MRKQTPTHFGRPKSDEDIARDQYLLYIEKNFQKNISKLKTATYKKNYAL